MGGVPCSGGSEEGGQGQASRVRSTDQDHERQPSKERVHTVEIPSDPLSAFSPPGSHRHPASIPRDENAEVVAGKDSG